MMDRRTLIRGAGAMALAGGSGWLANQAEADDGYKAVVVLFLMGGNDGHNLLVPLDAGYNDYAQARQGLALSRSSLLPLAGTAAGRSFGVHPALGSLADLYARQRLSFIANVGPLVGPTSAAAARANAAELPPFLFSHSDQVMLQQGWTVRDDLSGWGGRALEQLPPALRHPLAAMSMDQRTTLVTGLRSPVSVLNTFGAPRGFGIADIMQPDLPETKSLEQIARWQSGNAYEADYARNFTQSIADARLLTRALEAARPPAADFGAGELGEKLRVLASVLPVFKAQGYRRQVFLVSWGRFDTHANQRGSGPDTQDAQLAVMAQALAAFDATNRGNGVDDNVLTLMMSDFGRTVRPASGGGSEHAWGNHWFALGGPVSGGTVVGSFPSPVLGGPDDGDPLASGRHVPTTATDQVAATMARWLGAPASALTEVLPGLGAFPQATLPLLRS